MSYFGPEEFLLGVDFQVTCADGSEHESIVWKHCSDGVLRWYKADGTQVQGITAVSAGVLVAYRRVVEMAICNCQEER